MKDFAVRITDRRTNEERFLYSESNKGYLARAGAEIAMAARSVMEDGLNYSADDIADWLLFGVMDLTPVCTTSEQIEYSYHIDLTANGNVIVGYFRQGEEYKRYQVSTFIKKVNKARKQANTRTGSYKILRQPRDQNGRGYTKNERLTIANTIIHQMGGSGRLSAMVGMNNPMITSSDSPTPGVKFNFKGSRKANICQVFLLPDDTYRFELYRYTPVRYAHCPLVYQVDGLYFDQLVEVFERQTGLYLHL